MKRVWLSLAVLALPGVAAAAPCVPGTLASYVALGPTGCTVGSALFSQFATFAATGSATPIAASTIGVVPVDVAYQPGLRFELTAVAGPGDLLQALFGYRASGAAFTGNRLALAGTSVVPDGAITLVESKCLGGTFASGSSGCSATPATLIAFDIGIDADLSTALAFAAVGLVTVVNDLVIDGGTGGAASMSAATNQLTAVPEPATATLVALGAAYAAVRRRRRAPLPAHPCAAPGVHDRRSPRRMK